VRLEDYIEQDLLDRFEFHNYNHALEIITQAFPEEWADIVNCLRKLDITTDDLRQAGGNETNIPKKFDDVLYPLFEIRMRDFFLICHYDGTSLLFRC